MHHEPNASSNSSQNLQNRMYYSVQILQYPKAFASLVSVASMQKNEGCDVWNHIWRICHKNNLKISSSKEEKSVRQSISIFIRSKIVWTVLYLNSVSFIAAVRRCSHICSLIYVWNTGGFKQQVVCYNLNAKHENKFFSVSEISIDCIVNHNRLNIHGCWFDSFKDNCVSFHFESRRTHIVDTSTF